MDPQIERPQYYDGEYLGAADLQASVEYARAGLTRHELGAHLWGIGLGLDLVERPLPSGDVEVVLTPGIAWDGYGRQILALAPKVVGLDRFANLQAQTPAAGIPVQVWLTYEELPARSPGPGFSCPDETLFARVVEGYRIEIRDSPVADPHTVTVAAASIGAAAAQSTFDAGKGPLYDESVPQQDLSALDNLDRWPVFVGIVRWRKDLGQAGRLLPRIDADRNAARAGRRYLGAVAETIVAPDGLIRLRDRSKDPADPRTNLTPPIVAPPGAVNDLVWCEGHLRVVGDTRLQDGMLDYRVAGGGDAGVPMHLRRTAVNAPVPKTTLDAFIGTAAGAVGPAVPETRFTVSTTDAANNPKECLTVVTDGRVGIGAPDPTNTLQVEGPTGIRYQFGYLSGDDQAPAAASLAFNAHTRAGAWNFPDPLHQAAAVVLDDAGGVPEIKLQTNPNSMPAAPWTAHVVVKGNTGNLGVGVANPAARLHVGSSNPLQGQLQFFSPNADMEYDGGTDGLFLFQDNGGITAFRGGDVGIGTLAPQARLGVVGNPRQPGTAWFQADPAKGPHVSHVHWDATGDWYIRSASPFGKVIIQDSGGNVGVGTPSPTAKLHVLGIPTLEGTARFENLTKGPRASHIHWAATGDWYIRSASAGGRVILQDGGGRVGIGTANPATTLDVAGSLQVGGRAFISQAGLWTTSDRDEKTDIKPIEKPLEQLLALRGTSFSWRAAAAGGAPAGRHVGFVAQDVEAVFPEWVTETPQGAKAVNLTGLNALLLEAVRELAGRCDRLEADVADLRKRAGAPAPARRARKRRGGEPA